jgi:hypothetical protein
MAVPFLLRWYERGAVPVTVTLNVAVAGAVTAWLCGWALTVGGGGGVLEDPLPHPARETAKKYVRPTTERLRVALIDFLHSSKTNKVDSEPRFSLYPSVY